MLKLSFVFVILVLMVFCSCAACAQTNNPVALKGLDPILLARGKQVPGVAELTSTYQKFSYHFATAANKKTFDEAPAQHAVQFGGACVHAPTMDGDPNLFLVSEGKIYLAGSKGCMESVSGDLAAAIKATGEALGDQKVVAVMIFPNVQDIDYAGPVEVLSDTGYKIITVAATPKAIKTVAGINITPDYTFDDCPDAEVLLLPGGGVRPADRNDPQVQWVTKMAKKTPHILSVCNGAFWLAKAGLLDGKEATTTFGNLPLLEKYPAIRVRGDKRFTDNGQIITSAGLSAGIDGALHLVEKLEGTDIAHVVALNIEYDWRPENGFVRGVFADRNLLWTRRSGIKELSRNNIIRQRGDRDHWTVTWEADRGETSDSDLRKAFTQAALAQKWSDAGSSGDEMKFKFTDAEGATWLATVPMTKKDASKVVFTLELHRDGPKAGR